PTGRWQQSGQGGPDNNLGPVPSGTLSGAEGSFSGGEGGGAANDGGGCQEFRNRRSDRERTRPHSAEQGCRGDHVKWGLWGNSRQAAWRAWKRIDDHCEGARGRAWYCSIN